MRQEDLDVRLPGPDQDLLNVMSVVQRNQDFTAAKQLLMRHGQGERAALGACAGDHAAPPPWSLRRPRGSEPDGSTRGVPRNPRTRAGRRCSRSSWSSRPGGTRAVTPRPTSGGSSWRRPGRPARTRRSWPPATRSPTSRISPWPAASGTPSTTSSSSGSRSSTRRRATWAPTSRACGTGARSGTARASSPSPSPRPPPRAPRAARSSPRSPLRAVRAPARRQSGAQLLPERGRHQVDPRRALRCAGRPPGRPDARPRPPSPGVLPGPLRALGRGDGAAAPRRRPRRRAPLDDGHGPGRGLRGVPGAGGRFYYEANGGSPATLRH